MVSRSWNSCSVPIPLLQLLWLTSWLTPQICSAWVLSPPPQHAYSRYKTFLSVAIGLGPGDENVKELPRKDTLVAGVDYEVPDHEAHRLDRRSTLDERCDAWFAGLMQAPAGCLGETLCQNAYTSLTTLPVLRNDIEKDFEDPEWTPYVSTSLPWDILRPAYGLEAYGLPIPRRNAETWRHFDVPNMVEGDVDGSLLPSPASNIEALKEQLEAQWIPDEDCAARLVYCNGDFVAELSKTLPGVSNLDAVDDDVPDDIQRFMGRLTDGWTDELLAPVDVFQDDPLKSYSKLSGPHHNMGDPDTQFAINSQQGTACFAALNTWACRNVGLVHVTEEVDLPIVIVHVHTGDGGIDSGNENKSVGAAQHPRTVVVAEKGSKASIVQQSISINNEVDDARPLLVNGYTQVWLKENANITHCFVEESGGLPVKGVEERNDDLRSQETARKAAANTILETLDVHCAGDNSHYNATNIAVGGNGRTRLATSVSLLRPTSSCALNGFSLAGGNCRTDIKTNIHHMADGCASEQLQKNMVAGRATTSFRGRIRVEQPAQQTDSKQLSRTVLLTDTCRAWSIPSLEIIADDVQCTHGATVSDLSEEEIFYLRSRGLDPVEARQILMYAFGNEAVSKVPDAVAPGVLKRIRDRVGHLAPRGERAVKGDYQSV